jgi:hypothetical protein
MEAAAPRAEEGECPLDRGLRGGPASRADQGVCARDAEAKDTLPLRKGHRYGEELGEKGPSGRVADEPQSQTAMAATGIVFHTGNG